MLRSLQKYLIGFPWQPVLNGVIPLDPSGFSPPYGWLYPCLPIETMWGSHSN